MNQEAAEVPPVATVEQIMDKYRNLTGDTVADQIKADLYAREDELADRLRVIATHLGTYPEFVAFVLAEQGLGTPADETTMEFLHAGFHRRMAWLQEQFRGGEGGAPTG